MRVRAQIGMVLNLDKCIGCHTCSVTCKNVWTSRPGVEYAWFNNVETKPGIGYPKEWENQDKWNGGWTRLADGSIVPRQGGKWKLLIIRNLRVRPWRFNELRRDLEGISQKVLTDSLRQMEDDGLVFRHDYGENPPRVEYGLTELGRQMMPIMDSLADFGAYYKTVVS